ncbi:MAG: phosphate acyltransferase PlsX [Planctomycetes bacterium]|nr:phosphate acyltransferase PlsX [Planctomycetota bacterium]MBL7107127.1 phosphate acyltransferase PlsX [Phycisphaerae bacterium]
MRIALDAMGGDDAPGEIIAGVFESLEFLDPDDQLILVGQEKEIKSHIPLLAKRKKMVSIVDAPEIIGMNEKPIESLRKKVKSSISVLAKLAKQGKADAVISAGNTGACVAAFQMRMRNLPGVNRPGISVVLPTFKGPVTICDVGANIACKPINLYQYAVMAGIQSEFLLGVKKPRIGLMSIGEEDAKGNEIVKKAREMLKSDPNINFIGNIEGSDIFEGVCDVAVCEGFVGNVILKMAEGLVKGLFQSIKHELMQEKLRLALKFKPVMMRIYKKYDYNEYGGAPLLGVNGTALICHGSSKAKTIKNAVLNAKKYSNNQINEKITEYLSNSAIRNSDEQGS